MDLGRRGTKRGPYMGYMFLDSNEPINERSERDRKRKRVEESISEDSSHQDSSHENSSHENSSQEDSDHEDGNEDSDHEDGNEDSICLISHENIDSSAFYEIDSEDCDQDRMERYNRDSDSNSKNGSENETENEAETSEAETSEAETSDFNDNDNNEADAALGLNREPNRQRPYPTSQLKRALFIMSAKLKHNLNQEIAQTVQNILGVFDNSGIRTKTWKHVFKKILDNYSVDLQIHHFCPNCGFCVGIVQNDDVTINEDTKETFTTCQSCRNEFEVKKNITDRNFFIYVPLKDQLLEILKKNDITYPDKRVKKNPNALEDIYDGRLYKEKVKKGMISINMNIDGAPCFEKSGSTVLPILAMLNELPPKLRRRNIMLLGVWIGKDKPVVNEYLKPLIEEVNSLYRDGFEYVFDGTTYRKKCCVLACICDSVGRPTVRNNTQFNGEYGCGLCLHKGKEVPKDNGHVRVYPIVNGNSFGEGLRNHEETMIHAENQEKGMKQVPKISELPDFDIVRGLPPDSMHCLNLGVTKQESKLMFNSKNHEEDFYIGNRIKSVDRLLLKITPSLDVASTPRAMSDKGFWKAHEWFIYLYFYSTPILQRFLPGKYFQHWGLLVKSGYLLSQSSVTLSDVDTARTLIHEFVEKMPELYGEQHVLFNVHLLTHLPDDVLDLGPLWTHSAFPYEDFNQEILKYIHSSQGVPQQICDNFRLRYAVDNLLLDIENELSYAEQEVLTAILGRKSRPKITRKIMDHVYILGKSQKFQTLPDEHDLALARIHVNADSAISFEKFIRVLYNGEIIHSLDYKKPKKRKSFYVLLHDSEVFCIHFFLIMKTEHEESCYGIGKYFKKNMDPVIIRRYNSLKGLIPLSELQKELGAIRITDIKEKVVIVDIIDGLSFAGILPNRNEYTI